MQLLASVFQLPSEPGQYEQNRDRVDAYLQSSFREGVELVVVPELFDSGYCSQLDYHALLSYHYHKTIAWLIERSTRWNLSIAAGILEHADGHLHNSIAFIEPGRKVRFYRKHHLVFWEWKRFRRGAGPQIIPSRFGRIGFAICADMIYKSVWNHYRNKIDLAIVSGAWPEFMNRENQRPRLLYGRFGPLAGVIPGLVANDLGVPVLFANQCGETETKVPFLPRIPDRFSGLSAIHNPSTSGSMIAETSESVLIAPIDLPNRSREGVRTCPSMSRSGLVASSSMSAA